MIFRLSAVFLFLTLCLPGSRAQAPVPKPAPARENRVPVRLDALTLEPEIRSRVEAFFTILKQRKVDEAYRRLLDGSVLAEENPELVAKLIESTTRVLEVTGKVESTEILRIRAAGKNLREVTYILNGSKRPLRWKFFFYQAEDRWQVLDTNVAAEASGFFEEEK